MNKKGYYFTLDAFIALGIIFTILVLIQPISMEININPELHRDTIKVLSSLKMHEFDSYDLGDISISPNSSILEQIVELHAKGKPEAKEFAESLLSDLDPKENIGIWFNNQMIASNNNTPIHESEKIWTTRQLISGLEKDDATGYSARAYLTRTSDVEYFHFGGYIGDGNVSININSKGQPEEIILEITANRNFDVYINDEFSGHYNKSPTSTTPIMHDISSYIGHFNNGTNKIEIISKGHIYVAGGHFKITYEEAYGHEINNKRYLPGVEGLINIYDGFYVPGNLTEIEVNLKINTDNQSAFMTLGNKRIKNFSTTDLETIEITNQEMLEFFPDFSELSKETIPLRIGLEEVSFEKTDTLELISIFESTAETDPYISQLQSSHYTLINETSKIPNSRMGVIGYRSALPTPLLDELTEDFEHLRSRVDGWEDEGGNFVGQNRDLCIALEEAMDYFEDKNNPPLVDDPIKISTIMSAGKLTHCGGGASEEEANSEAVYRACEIAHKQKNITFYTVGFGDNENTLNTLQEIAECSGGEYYEGELGEMDDVYEKMISDIILDFQLQTIIGEDGQEVHTEISPESYIEYKYESEPLPHGLLITSESDTFNASSETTFYVPEDSIPIEAEVISYSGPKWTQSLSYYNYSEEKWITIFNLSEYGEDYTQLGDPYFINIPKDKIEIGNNKVRLMRGSSPSDSSLGSESNKVIYTILKEGLGYSPISASAIGCEWTIEFYDLSNTTIDISKNTTEEKCYYTSEKIVYNENDAIDTAVYELLSSLDFNSDGKIDSKFSTRDLDIETSEISDIPYAYQSVVDVRIWR